jgi:hypothetical protein
MSDGDLVTRHLKETILALREELELREAQHQEQLRDIVLHHDREKLELQRTISKLRESLEQLHESNKKANNTGKASAPAASG